MSSLAGLVSSRPLRFVAARRWTALAIVVLAGVGLAEVQGTPIAWDETFEVEMLDQNIAHALRGAPIRGDLKFYGTVFNLSAELAHRAWQFVVGQDRGDAHRRQLARLRFKHWITFLWALLAYVAAAGLVELLLGPSRGWLGIAALAAFPRYWSHGFFNPKDIPFASVFAVCTWLAALMLTRAPRGRGRRLLVASLFGVLVGLTAGVRVGGLALLAFVPVGELVRRFSEVPERRSGHGIDSWLCTVATSLLTLFAVQPAAWGAPLQWLIDCLRYLSRHGFSGSNLYGGKFVSAKDLPWTYLPTWFAITTPILVELAFVLGIVAILVGRRALDAHKRTAWALMALQLGFLPLVAIMKGSVLYDGMRQFLFVIPVAAVVVAIGASFAFDLLRRPAARAALIAVVVVAQARTWQVQASLHPYGYLYFNEWAGGLKGAHLRYETDYWALSLEEATEWTVKNAASGSRILVAGNDFVARMFVPPDMKVYSIYTDSNVPRPHYYVAAPKWDWQRKPGCVEVHRVVRDEVPLTTVQTCE